MYSPLLTSCKQGLSVSFPKLLLSGSFLALLCGCAVGPDYARPETADAKHYDEQGAPTTEATDGAHGAAQSFDPTANIPAQWWALYQSPALNDLVTQALLHNPDLDAAKASLRAAEENLLAGGGELYPTVGADFSATREKTSSASTDSHFSLRGGTSDMPKMMTKATAIITR